MTAEHNPLLGKWRITGMDLWDAAHIDLLGHGFIRFDADGGGEMGFGALQATLDCHWGSRSMHFTWEGSDEGEHLSGDGDAEVAATERRKRDFERGATVPEVGPSL